MAIWNFLRNFACSMKNKTKRMALAALVALCGLTAAAQEDNRLLLPSTSAMPANDFIAPDTDLEGDSLHLPLLDEMGRMPSYTGFYPYYFGGSWSNWKLHKGMNLSLGASVFSQIGKNAYGGVGFAQNLSAQYATTLSPRLSIAVGGYLNNMYWAHNAYRDVGLTAVLGYRFDEHWEGYLYGQKSIMTNMPIPYYLQDMNDMGDRIGAAVRYNFSPNFSVQMSVESRRVNSR